MINFKNAINDYYEREIAVIKRLDLNELNKAINIIYETYINDGTIYICGNGGSSQTASHMQTDLNKGISEFIDKKFRCYCLNNNISDITAIANDIGYEEIFRFPLLNKINKNDLFIGISGSGNSKNVLNAAKYASKSGAKVLGITGYTGGELKKISDYNMHVAEMDMQISEDLHMSFCHVIRKILYNYLINNVISSENMEDKY